LTSSGALLICGATSGAGKSTITAALARSWARRGLRVAPFKAQNMSNHAAVTVDNGEVGRAQAMQAAAAGVPLDRRMNPILLKPSSEVGSHLVVMGDERSVTDAQTYGATSRDLRSTVLDAFTSLRSDYDWVVAEGAGGAAEINLLDRDLVNLPLAKAAGMPAIVVVDIEPGGAFAAAHGTVDLLPPELRAMVAGVIINKFRGDSRLLDSGLATLEERTGVPVLGVLSFLDDHLPLGVEDSLNLHAGPRSAVRSERPVRVVALRLPHLANPADLDPFLIEPDVEFRWAMRPEEMHDADLIVVPGSRATVADLAWLRERGFEPVLSHTEAIVVGVCAGYQMLGRTIRDDVESQAGVVAGLGLLDVETTFERPKLVRRSRGRADGEEVDGYQIRFGRPSGEGRPWLELDGEPEGCVARSDTVFGSSLHGLFDADGFRSGLLRSVASRRDREYAPAAVGFADELEAYHDRLADWLEADLYDIDRLQTIAATADTVEEAPGW